jgi:hypothetical protein
MRMVLALLLVVLFVLVALPGCSVRPWNLRTFPSCSDGLPVKILIDKTCPPDGVCGYSCLPDRWVYSAQCAVGVRPHVVPQGP